jgi:hypothetical protein
MSDTKAAHPVWPALLIVTMRAHQMMAQPDRAADPRALGKRPLRVRPWPIVVIDYAVTTVMRIAATMAATRYGEAFGWRWVGAIVRGGHRFP